MRVRVPIHLCVRAWFGAAYVSVCVYMCAGLCVCVQGWVCVYMAMLRRVCDSECDQTCPLVWEKPSA